MSKKKKSNILREWWWTPIWIIFFLMIVLWSITARGGEWDFPDFPTPEQVGKAEVLNDMFTDEQTLRYNVMEQEWEYSAPQSRERYNPMEDRWELAE